jgi:hypothetical protein
MFHPMEVSRVVAFPKHTFLPLAEVAAYATTRRHHFRVILTLKSATLALSKDDERLCATSEALIYATIIRLMLRRLAHA